MKKLIIYIACVLLIMSIFPASAFADNTAPVTTSDITVFEDGSYCVTTISEKREPTYGLLKALATRSTKTASKTTAYHNSNGQKLYSVTVTGTFSYNGSTSTATSAEYSYSISYSTWNFVSGSAGRSGNTATATCKFKYGISYSRTLSVSLSCSPNGTLS